MTVDVDATRAGELSLSIEYMVPGAADWQPTYAARLNPRPGESRSICSRACSNERARTGATSASRSHHRARVGLAADLRRWQLARTAQRSRAGARRASWARSARPTAGKRWPYDGAARTRAYEPATPISERAGVAESNLLAASIAIPGRISVGSGAAPRRILASHSDFQSALEHRAAPRQSSSVFLAARFRNSGAVPLLAGPAALFVGTDYVGTTSITQTATEDELVLPFGVDTGITIDRTLAGRDTTQVAGRVRSTVRFAFRVNNHRDRAVDVIVLDQLGLAHRRSLGRDRPGQPCGRAARRRLPAGSCAGVSTPTRARTSAGRSATR